MEEKSFAQVAYEAYASHQGWKNFFGQPLPPWVELFPDIAEAWEFAVGEVLATVDSTVPGE